MRKTGNNALELKSPAELVKMRRSGEILTRVLNEVISLVQPGITTVELDNVAYARIKEAGAHPAFKGLYGFPKTLCISVNEEVVHGIPNKRKLVEGDIISIDCGVRFEGFYSDKAFTVPVGRVSERVQKLLDVTQKALLLAIETCKPGNRLGDLGAAVQRHAEANGMYIVKDYGGHGIGRHLHEAPRVENYGEPGRGERMKPGMVLAIEPMIALGTGDTETLRDGWTVITADHSPSAHFEHTVAITTDGHEILTKNYPDEG